MRQLFSLWLPALLCVALGASFWLSAGWLQVCAGLALFLFGMQCLEEGLGQLAGGRLEQWLGRSTATPFKSLLFGMAGTTVLQSSTLVSLLTIAFIGTGLITLSSGIAIIFGANLGATTGIWLLALAGHGFSLSPLALPLLVLGVLAGVFGPKSKAAGRIVLGIAFIFMGIDQLRTGFEAFGASLDMARLPLSGVAGQLLFAGLGLLVTAVLQSGHATLMLALAALSAGQLELWQAFALTVGTNVGATVGTALGGFLGGNRSGQRLALVHVLFNGVTALVVFPLLDPLGGLVQALLRMAGAGHNELLQLALFQSLFKLFGMLLFWPWQVQLARGLQRWLPEREEPPVLTCKLCPGEAPTAPVRARYLSEAALSSADAAVQAVTQELRHLTRLSLEVICHALYQPVEQLMRPQMDEDWLRRRPEPDAPEAEQLYQCYIKGVHADLLSFMSRLEAGPYEAHGPFWLTCQVAALQLVDAVKDAKHLQKNLGRYLREDGSPAQTHYLALRRQLLWTLRQLREVARLEAADAVWLSRLDWLDAQAAAFDRAFRERLFAEVRAARLDGMQASSLMNDLGYASRIVQSLRNVVRLGKGGETLPALQPLLPDDESPAS